MKLILINTTANTGSTGHIAEEIGLLAQQAGYEVRFAYGRNAVNSQLSLIKIGGKWDIHWHGVKSRLMDAHGFASVQATKTLIAELEIWKPDLVNIHNIHGYYINIEILFDYFKRKQIPVVWTFHDCWPFTGHCSFFDKFECRKWETECHHCPNRRGYPESWFIDRSKSNFSRKKEIFNGLNNLTIITPSEWLADHVSRSFLGDYPIKVINNGVGLDSFSPVVEKNLLIKYGVDKKPYILGVASIWDQRKGFDDFVKLRNILSSEISIVLVGLSEVQSAKMPSGIISVARTESQQELAALYSAAMVFVNPTYTDNFPTTNIEALACGTPVITYNTGGSPEAIDAETGFVVEKGNIEALKNSIETIVKHGKESYSVKCRQRAEQLYNKRDRFQEYISLFKQMLD